MKNRVIKIAFCLFSITLFSASVFSQQVVTLRDALNYALENSEVMKQARLDIENGKVKVTESMASAMPQINLNSSITGNPIVQQFVLPAAFMGGSPDDFVAIRAGQNWSAMTQVTLSQQIYNQQVFAGLKAAKGSKQFYELSAQLSEENVLQLVATNYYQLVVTQTKMGVLEANIDRVIKLEDILAAQFENGLVKKIDVDRVRVNKTNLQAQKLELENAVIQMKNLLKYYIGMPMDQDITVPETALNDMENFGESIDGSSLNTDNLLSMQVMNKQAELLALQTKVFRAGYIPSLYLTGHYTYNTQSNKFNLYSKKALSYDMSSFSLNLSIPIFDGLARSSKVKSSEIQLKQLREEMSRTTNALTMAYENARMQIANSIKMIDAQKANKELANEVFEVTQNNYQLGLASLTDLINAETELRTAENSYSEALLQYKVAELELIKSKGEISSLLNK
ncbi:MAG: TolC family protein [Crocinitomicaceae bacterium]|nr:TolC family protein [Crocinitomicaceae bacterium]